MGTYLARPVTRKEREDPPTAPSGLRCASASMQGWRVAQEDAHFALPEFDAKRGISLFGVFDGHCGGVVARLVAEWLPGKLQKSPAFRKGNYAKGLDEAFRAVDKCLDSSYGRRAVFNEATKVRAGFMEGLRLDADCEAEGLSVMEMLDNLCADDPDGMGTTAIVALLEHRNGDISQPPVRIHVANCGDSRCVLMDDRGRACGLSRDHTPRCKEELARITAAGSYVTVDGRIEDNLNLSRSLGDFAYKRTRKTKPAEQQIISGVPEVKSRDLRKTDRYVFLGCDGIWETKKGSQATLDVLKGLMPKPGTKTKLSQPLSAFLDQNLAQDESTGVGLDNMTLMCLELPDLSQAPEPPAVAAKPVRVRDRKRAAPTAAPSGVPVAKRPARQRPVAATRGK